ncbi:MAG: hypothetical protein V5A43_03430 [Haloarculaceae archaeon]
MVPPVGFGGLEGVVLSLVGSVLVIAFGTYAGVTFALHSLFGSDSEDASRADATGERLAHEDGSREHETRTDA